jgi:hypothetical protein
MHGSIFLTPKHWPDPGSRTGEQVASRRGQNALLPRDSLKFSDWHEGNVTLLQYLDDIYAYNQQHAKSYAKRFREGSKDWRNCETIFSEVTVYGRRSFAQVCGITSRLGFRAC